MPWAVRLKVGCGGGARSDSSVKNLNTIEKAKNACEVDQASYGLNRKRTPIQSKKLDFESFSLAVDFHNGTHLSGFETGVWQVLCEYDVFTPADASQTPPTPTASSKILPGSFSNILL
jgi:hypothetical protein